MKPKPMKRSLRRVRRGLLAVVLNGGWALLAALPVAAALLTWWDGLG